MSEQRTTSKANHPVCKAIREVRKEVGLTQVQLAELLGLIQPYVSAWETIRIPTVDQIADIEAALKVPAGTVLRRAGYVADQSTMTAEEKIHLDQTISRSTRQVILSILEADRLKAQQPEGRRRPRTSE